MTIPAPPFGRETIESIIPHRPPFLLVDEVLELEPGRKVRGRFRVPEDGWWFQGHFPDRPVMPGVLTVEAIAQCGAVAVLADEANRGKIPFFAGIDDCRFKRVVEPGDVLDLECEFLRVRGPIAKGQGRASVDGDVAVEAMLTVFVGTEADDRQRRLPRHDHGSRGVRARAGDRERRARTDGRHVGRVDHRAHGHPRAANRGRRAGALRSRDARGAAGARAGG